MIRNNWQLTVAAPTRLAENSLVGNLIFIFPVSDSTSNVAEQIRHSLFQRTGCNFLCLLLFFVKRPILLHKVSLLKNCSQEIET